MKQLLLISSAAVMLATLTACNSGFSTSRASAKPYEIVVVMNKAIWDGNTGQAIKNELIKPDIYIPQEENAMKITYAMPDQFNGIMRSYRNVLLVDINDRMYTKVSLQNENDTWAKGQAILKINAPEASMIDSFLVTNPGDINDYFNREELKRMKVLLKESYSTLVMEKVREKFGIAINAPSDIKSCKEGDDCLWFSNDAPSCRMDLLVYTFPFTDKNTFTLDYLVNQRDSITKKMIPGSFPNSYMATEKQVVDYFASSLHGKYCGILRGWWKMKGDMMGGPFVSYARVDEQNRRVIVTEGFVYEPEKAKRNYIRRMEAALQTTLFADEQQNASDNTLANNTLQQ
ncbi:MAG: DUF4837 family protein [Tannerella sp.]|jgi:hypothetical protein|nr:DUF4837 family protein [Tannerella sp.]